MIWNRVFCSLMLEFDIGISFIGVRSSGDSLPVISCRCNFFHVREPEVRL